MNRIFVDCEFIDTGRRLELASIGLEKDRPRGLGYYAEVEDIDSVALGQASPWFMEHVWQHLGGDGGRHLKERAQIAEEVREFVGPKPPTFFAYVDHYDWVLLSQLFGPLVRRPAHWPWGSVNLHQLAQLCRYDAEAEMPKEWDMPGWEWLPEGAHHARAGAAWDRLLAERLAGLVDTDPHLRAVLGELLP